MKKYILGLVCAVVFEVIARLVNDNVEAIRGDALLQASGWIACMIFFMISGMSFKIPKNGTRKSR